MSKLLKVLLFVPDKWWSHLLPPLPVLLQLDYQKSTDLQGETWAISLEPPDVDSMILWVSWCVCLPPKQLLWLYCLINNFKAFSLLTHQFLSVRFASSPSHRVLAVATPKRQNPAPELHGFFLSHHTTPTWCFFPAESWAFLERSQG